MLDPLSTVEPLQHQLVLLSFRFLDLLSLNVPLPFVLNGPVFLCLLVFIGYAWILAVMPLPSDNLDILSVVLLVLRRS